MDVLLMQITLPAAIATVIGFVLGICLTVIIYQIVSREKAKTFKQDLERQIEGASREAENIIKSAQIEAAAENIRKKEQFAAETNRFRSELRETEVRLSKREDTLDRQGDIIQQKEKSLKQQEQEVERRLNNLSSKESQLTGLMAQQKNQLLKISAMNVDEARELLLKRLEEECEQEMSTLIKRKLDETNELVEEKSREILSSAIQRYAAEHTCEVSVSTVEIPNDDMKGRIIGREGRNIRAFEKATGVDVIVDDTPGMIVVSGFNPVRREVARLSMERLIQDGRIHPSRIEELVAQTKKEVNHKVLQLGKDASVETNVRGLNNRVLSLLGALNFRT
ncbi:MAG: Rnase Y domain-containing protein, partial [Planctomycetota bacterium]|nr:Rnase Y domain-containing protein [Planctomycetota bacterium]